MTIFNHKKSKSKYNSKCTLNQASFIPIAKIHNHSASMDFMICAVTSSLQSLHQPEQLLLQLTCYAILCLFLSTQRYGHFKETEFIITAY